MNNRLGLSPGATTADINAALDVRFQDACTHVKAAGIVVYVIRLELGDAYSENLLRTCASSPSHFLDVPDSAGLSAAFESIRNDLMRLYLSK